MDYEKMWNELKKFTKEKRDITDVADFKIIFTLIEMTMDELEKENE